MVVYEMNHSEISPKKLLSQFNKFDLIKLFIQLSLTSLYRNKKEKKKSLQQISIPKKQQLLRL